eukprot:749759-Hanusia_phi.AAC.1
MWKFRKSEVPAGQKASELRKDRTPSACQQHSSLNTMERWAPWGSCVSVCRSFRSSLEAFDTEA